MTAVAGLPNMWLRMDDPATPADGAASAAADATEALLRRWHAGDRAALHELVARDMPWIRKRVHDRLGQALRHHGDTDDFLNEVVIDLLAYTPRFLAADGDVFRRLVARIVENSLRGRSEFYARLRRDQARQAPLPDDTVLALSGDRRPATTPSQHAARAEEEGWLRLALDLIEPDDRDLIVMREWNGDAFAAIGERLGVPENTARMRFSRAVGRLALQVEALRRGIV